MYIYLNSESSNRYYNDNSPSSFRVKLPNTLHMSPLGAWEVALLDIDMPKLSENYAPAYLDLHSSICQPSIVNLSLKPILQRLYFYTIDSGTTIAIDNPRYVPVNASRLDTIDIYIIDNLGNPASFRNNHLTCTLHFKKITD